MSTGQLRQAIDNLVEAGEAALLRTSPLRTTAPHEHRDHDAGTRQAGSMKLENWLVLQERFDTRPQSHQYWPPYQIQHEDIIVKYSSNDWTEDFLLHPRGGSFTIDIPLHRKHKIAHLVKPKPGRFLAGKKIGEILCAFKLLNTTA